MANKQAASFPFAFITHWIRPSHPHQERCLFCMKDQATYRMHYFLDIFSWMSQGSAVLDIDSSWQRAIKKQMKGIYQPEGYQPACDECMQRMVSIQLGSKCSMRQLLEFADLLKNQHGLEVSHVLCCTVSSVNDEGDTWAMNAPNTTIEEVVQHIKSKGM